MTKIEPCDDTRFRGKCTGECLLGKDTVDIEIEDTGTGIPPEVLPKIFDPFFTTKDTGKSSDRGLFVGKGSGLGLYIVEEIIKEHGGCIAVRQHCRQRNMFSYKTAFKGVTMYKTGKILIIDDEKITLKNLEHVMKKEGYEVAGDRSRTTCP